MVRASILRRGLGSIASLLVVVFGLHATVLSEESPDLDLPVLNRKVLEYAQSQVGKKVGDGSCVTLAVKAIHAAGARRFPFDRDGDYVWGEPVDSFREALPGDILQFRNAVFQGKQRLPRRRLRTWHESFPHHTAIVSQVRDGGKTVGLLHQNVAREGDDEETKKTVKESLLKPDSLQKGGWVRIYRPLPPSNISEN